MVGKGNDKTPSLRTRVRERLFRGKDRQRPGWYDGSETPDPTPPYRYARGKKAVPAPPPGGAF